MMNENDQASRKRGHEKDRLKRASGPGVGGEPPTLSFSSGEREQGFGVVKAQPVNAELKTGYLTMQGQNPNQLCPPLNLPTILGTKTAPFFAVLSSGSLDYQRLTAIWEPPPLFLIQKRSSQERLEVIRPKRGHFPPNHIRRFAKNVPFFGGNRENLPARS